MSNPAPKSGSRSTVSVAWQLWTSPATSIGLLVWLAVLCVHAMLTYDAEGSSLFHPYRGTPAVLTPLVLTIANLLCRLFARTSRHFISVVLIRAGLVIFLSGVIVTHLWGVEGLIHIPEGSVRTHFVSYDHRGRILIERDGVSTELLFRPSEPGHADQLIPVEQELLVPGTPGKIMVDAVAIVESQEIVSAKSGEGELSREIILIRPDGERESFWFAASPEKMSQVIDGITMQYLPASSGDELEAWMTPTAGETPGKILYLTDEMESPVELALDAVDWTQLPGTEWTYRVVNVFEHLVMEDPENPTEGEEGGAKAIRIAFLSPEGEEIQQTMLGEIPEFHFQHHEEFWEAAPFQAMYLVSRTLADQLNEETSEVHLLADTGESVEWVHWIPGEGPVRRMLSTEDPVALGEGTQLLSGKRLDSTTLNTMEPIDQLRFRLLYPGDSDRELKLRANDEIEIEVSGNPWRIRYETEPLGFEIQLAESRRRLTTGGGTPDLESSVNIRKPGGVWKPYLVATGSPCLYEDVSLYKAGQVAGPGMTFEMAVLRAVRDPGHEATQIGIAMTTAGVFLWMAWTFGPLLPRRRRRRRNARQKA